MMRRIATVAEMTVRDIVRRRAVVVLLFSTPLAFYFAQHGRLGQSIRLASLGLAWAVATLALFAGSAGRRLDHRLRLSGYRTTELWLGRLAGLLGLGWAMAGVYFAIIVLDQAPWRAETIAVGLALSVVIAVGVGLCVSEIVTRELEGSLALIAVVGLQMVMDPAAAAAKVLPLWSTRELLTYAIDQMEVDYLVRGLAHGLAVTAALLATTAVIASQRLRSVRPPTRRTDPRRATV
jgi:hypothetical protein